MVRLLRRALDDIDVEVATDPAGYRLTVPADWIDLHRFRSLLADAEQAESSIDTGAAISRLREALDLWRGPALAGLTGRRLVGVAAVLDEQRLTAVEHLTALQLRAGQLETWSANSRNSSRNTRCASRSGPVS